MSGKKDDEIDLDAWSSFLEDDPEVLDRITQEGRESALQQKKERVEAARRYFQRAQAETDLQKGAWMAVHILQPFIEHVWTREELPEDFIREVEVFLEKRRKEGHLSYTGPWEKLTPTIDQLSISGPPLISHDERMQTMRMTSMRDQSSMKKKKKSIQLPDLPVRQIDDNSFEIDVSLESQLKRLEMNKDNANAHGGVALALFARRKYKEAEKYAREAYRLWSKECSGDLSKLGSISIMQRAADVLILAKILTALKEFEQSIPFYKDALRFITPPDDSWNELGVALGRTDQLLEAMRAFQNAIKFDPENTIYWQNLKKTYEGLKQYEESAICQGVLDGNRSVSEARAKLGIK